MIIYKATNLINNKFYIGKTILTLEKRIKKHLRKSRKSDLPFHRALRKYGNDKFKWEIINICQGVKELNEMEKYFIKNTNAQKIGYNIAAGGEGGNGWVSMKGKCGKEAPNYGNSHSEETKEILRRKLSGENSPMYGKRGKDHPVYGLTWKQGPKKNSPKIFQFTTDGILVKEWRALYYIKSETNFNGSKIRACINRTAKSAYNFIWCYEQDVNNINKFVNEYINRYKCKKAKENILLERNCPICDKLIKYSSKGKLKKATIKKTKCSSCRNKGINNPMYKHGKRICK